MSPSSLLYTPVELLRTSPPEGAQSSNGEDRERRAALLVFGGVVLVALLAGGVALHSSAPAACAGAPAAHGAPACPAGR